MKKFIISSLVMLALAVVPAMATVYGLGETVTTTVSATIASYAVINQSDPTIAFTTAEMDPLATGWVTAADTAVGTFQSNVDVSVNFAAGVDLTLEDYIGDPPTPTLDTKTQVTVTWPGGGQFGPTGFVDVESFGGVSVPLTAGKIYTVTAEAQALRSGLSDPMGSYVTELTLTVTVP